METEAPSVLKFQKIKNGQTDKKNNRTKIIKSPRSRQFLEERHHRTQHGNRHTTSARIDDRNGLTDGRRTRHIHGINPSGKLKCSCGPVDFTRRRKCVIHGSVN